MTRLSVQRGWLIGFNVGLELRIELLPTSVQRETMLLKLLLFRRVRKKKERLNFSLNKEKNAGHILKLNL